MSKIVLIDGHSILNRAFFGLPDLTNAEGLHTNAIYGFLNIMFKILEEEKPEYLTVAFDVHAPTFRHKMFEAYKGTRKPMAEELRQQVPLMKEVLHAMGIRTIEQEGLEADDLLGTLSKRCERMGMEVVIISGDRDLLQLATDHVEIRIPKTKRTGTEIENYYAVDVKEKYQVTPTEFIDVKALMGDTSDNIPGNRNPKVVAAVKDQLDDIMHTFNYPYTIPQALLAKKICDTIGMDKIFFQNSGTEANECMIKMARKYGVEKYGPEHYHIVTAINGFHGRTYGALSATGQPDNACQLGFKPMLPGFSYAEYNNLEDFKSKVTDNTIAIMIEPVQGEGGVHPATQEFIEGLRKLCDERGMLLLFDEVQTGWGRTGSPMAFMGYGVKPDCVTMAKAMGGGMPIGACCASEEVAAVFTSGTHGSTYGGHPLACAASLASISEILDRDLSGNAKVMGEYMKEKLAELPHVKEARGKGLLVGCEYDIPIALEVKWACFRRRLLITAIGDSVNRMIPPLILAKEHVDQAIEIMRDAINEAAAKYEADQKTA